MHYDVETASHYFEALEDDWRKEKLLEIRDTILSKAPELEESIEYKMLRYGDDKTSVFHLNAQKNYVSLYVGNINKIDDSGELLKGLNVGKGCIRFKKSLSLSETRIDEFIERTIRLWRNKEDTAC
jgi:uncharacterized protein YdhG (YjbR/CyaY superfamily)